MKTKEAIKRNFSRYAEYYDTHSSVQDQVGLELITSLNTGEFEKILDIGCGTGNYTRLLRDKFPTATIMAVDICGKMIEVAQRKLQDRRIEFVRADAETMAPTESFGLITSNACFQWFDNLEKAIAGYKNLLANDGTILFSIFGPLTLCELSKSLCHHNLGQQHKLSIILNTFFSMSSKSAFVTLRGGHKYITLPKGRKIRFASIPSWKTHCPILSAISKFFFVLLSLTNSIAPTMPINLTSPTKLNGLKFSKPA